jgi:hypothetical protein
MWAKIMKFLINGQKFSSTDQIVPVEVEYDPKSGRQKDIWTSK